MSADFDEFVRSYHDALDEFFRGNSEPAKRLYSHRDDVSLANPFGPVATGWPQVQDTMERAAANYEDGGATGFDTIVLHVGGELSYTVEVEHFQAKVGGADELASGALRVTSILRQEGGEWRIVHRHADPITSARPASSILPP